MSSNTAYEPRPDDDTTITSSNMVIGAYNQDSALATVNEPSWIASLGRMGFDRKLAGKTGFFLGFSFFSIFAVIWAIIMLAFCFLSGGIELTQARGLRRIKPWRKSLDWQIQSAGNIIRKIKPVDVKACDEDIRIAAGFEVLCTYEWKNTPLEDHKPTIYVPGFGRRFSKPALPCKVDQDSGEAWKDQHLARVRTFQFEPIFQALSIMNPNVRFNNVDIVIGRSNLLQLLHFVEGKDRQTFALDLKLINKTLFVHTKGGKGRVSATKDSYGRNFERQFTEAIGEADADGYHRVLQYKLGPLNMVVRMEADAFLDDVDNPVCDDVRETFRGNKSVEIAHEKAGIAHVWVTTVIPGGKYIPQAKMTELKSTNAGIGAMVSKAMPQLWAGRINTVVVGDRKSGAVDSSDTALKMTKKQKKAAAAQLAADKKDGEIGGFATFYQADVQDITQDRLDWEDENKEKLQRLSGLLQELLQIVGRTEQGKALLRKGDRNGPIELYEAGEDEVEALPKQIVDVFWD